MKDDDWLIGQRNENVFYFYEAFDGAYKYTKEQRDVYNNGKGIFFRNAASSVLNKISQASFDRLIDKNRAGGDGKF